MDFIHDVIIPTMLMGLICFAIGIMIFIFFDRTYENRMKECRADGHKEYECASMLKSCSRYSGY